MKKIIFILATALLLVAGCGGASLRISVENSPSFVEAGESEIVLRVDDGDKAVTGADLIGTLEMARMDHGVIEVIFTDNGDGTYTAMLDLPMGGEWIMATDVELDGSTYEQTITFEVNEG